MGTMRIWGRALFLSGACAAAMLASPRAQARTYNVTPSSSCSLALAIQAVNTQTGQGSCLGHRFEHLRAILDRASDRSRLGVCVDTCHIFAAGYPLGDPERYDETLAALDRIVGLELVRVWHLNDSVRGLASRVDRHAGIGVGLLGLERARLQAERLVVQAKGHLDGFGERGDLLRMLADFTIERRS